MQRDNELHTARSESELLGQDLTPMHHVGHGFENKAYRVVTGTGKNPISTAVSEPNVIRPSQKAALEARKRFTTQLK